MLKRAVAVTDSVAATPVKAGKSPKTIGRVVKNRLAASNFGKKAVQHAATYSSYQRKKFEVTREWTEYTHLYPQFTTGFHELLGLRVGGFRSAEWRANSGSIDPKFKTECPFCHQKEPETLAHMMIVCPRWKIQRNIYIGDLITRARGKTLSIDDAATLLLGGECTGERIRNWPILKVNSPEAKVNCPCIQVSAFLMKVAPQRIATLRSIALTPKPRRGAGSSKGQLPNG